jgi:hypothetical protein
MVHPSAHVFGNVAVRQIAEAVQYSSAFRPPIGVLLDSSDFAVDG